MPVRQNAARQKTARQKAAPPTAQDPLQAGSPLRTPRAAAVAGIVFSVLLIASLVLLRVSTPANPGDAGVWLTDSRRRAAVATALNLIPFAGIAFLWLIGAVRDRIGRHEDRFFATVFLGSGLLFVGMLFVAAAVGGGLIAAASRHSGSGDANTLALGRNVTSTLLNVYAIRMAAVFTLTTVTIARRTGIVRRWLLYAGLATALVLLVGVSISVWVELLFPAWILALSLDILVAGPRASAGTQEAASPAAHASSRIPQPPGDLPPSPAAADLSPRQGDARHGPAGHRYWRGAAMAARRALGGGRCVAAAGWLAALSVISSGGALGGG
jgi:hypothetical protein